jgi:hypothetical protein
LDCDAEAAGFSGTQAATTKPPARRKAPKTALERDERMNASEKEGL